jgi:plasmid rolling circle replication initiator protein Rep
MSPDYRTKSLYKNILKYSFENMAETKYLEKTETNKKYFSRILRLPKEQRSKPTEP